MSSDNSAVIDQALSNLKEIRDNSADEYEFEVNEALGEARRELTRLYNQFGELATILPKRKVHIGVARWKSKNGHCRYNTRLTRYTFGERVTGYEESRGHHTLVINERIYEQGNTEDFKRIVQHELAHALCYAQHGSSQKHNENWKQMAERLGVEDPSSCSNAKTTDKPYTYGCVNGCWSSGKSRRSKKVKRPWSNGRYCKQCGETPASCDSHKDVTNCEPGEVAVDSIGWSNKEEYRE